MSPLSTWMSMVFTSSSSQLFCIEKLRWTSLPIPSARRLSRYHRTHSTTPGTNANNPNRRRGDVADTTSTKPAISTVIGAPSPCAQNASSSTTPSHTASARRPRSP